MQQKEDKSELLNQLKIDRSEPKAHRLSFNTLAAVLCAALVVMLAVYLAKDESVSPVVAQLLPEEEKRTLIKSVKAAKDTQRLEMAIQEEARKEGMNKQGAILNASGYVSARLIATVSSEVMGLITEVKVEEGMQVEQGQVLAKLDGSVSAINLDLAKAQVAVGEAQLRSLKADVNEARRVLDRVSNLENVDYSSEADLTRAKADLEKALSALATTKANIEVSKLQVAQQQEVFDNHTIRAPFAGVVTVKNAQPGEIVSPSSAGGGFTRTGICTIVDMSSLEIEVDVNEAFIRRVYSGQRVVANLDAYPQWDIPASVIAIIPTADRAKATVRVRIKIDLKDKRILPDMGVKVAFLK
ncbi:efflux RND transporter periplasmic adaptor subunit [Agarilytica rhodophyticola]|uniref:efflux RND transporter periplasmic adaptor subunit n=1 Tax=Agarilytica rhodophyticola TaxID=1737490 RepID=UPI001FEB7320|nr:efflux RND transporter periplasmic adaptor subunit [Agarilytica rhodophyticola]